jgi:hypothetical protein
VAFSPDGKRIASGGGKGLNDPEKPAELKVWNAESGQQVLSIPGLVGWVSNVGFSADGQRISGRVRGKGDTEKVLTWDATTGRLLPDARPASLEEPDEEVTSPDGSLRVPSREGVLEIVRLLDFFVAQKRQQAEDRAFLERLARPDPGYHRQKADLYEKSGNLFAAAFHLRRLLVLAPKEEAVRKRLATVEARLEAATRTEIPLPEKQPAKMPYVP